MTGLAENMEYVITPAVVVGAMGFLSHDIVFDLTGADGWWNSLADWTIPEGERIDRDRIGLAPRTAQQ